MARSMKPEFKTGRRKTLTHDTSKFIDHTCRAFVDLGKYMLESGSSYVIFGWFSTDFLEKYFGKLRQGAGGQYFLNAQTVLEKNNINRAKLSLKFGCDDWKKEDSGHQCDSCDKQMSEKEAEIMDNLASLENNLSTDTIAALVYIAGYIQMKSKIELKSDTKYYYENYLNAIDKTID